MSEEAKTPADQQAETSIPEVGDHKIPLWVKLMWLGGMIWVIWYIISGMQSNPDAWA